MTRLWPLPHVQLHDSDGRETVNCGHESQGTAGPQWFFWRHPVTIRQSRRTWISTAGLRNNNDCASDGQHKHTCKMWGFRGGDYKERRLLEYRKPVRTSQETHYVSATETSRLILCKIWGFHGGDHEQCRHLGYCVIWLLQEPTYQRNVSPPSSEWQESAS
jgi:hypothetical protein